MWTTGDRKVGIFGTFRHICIVTHIIRFGENAELLHGFERPFSAAAGAHVLQHLSFAQARTNFVEVSTYIHSGCILYLVGTILL